MFNDYFYRKFNKMSHNFHTLKVKEVKRETRDTVSIALDIPEAIQKEFEFAAGQYLTFKKIINGEEVRRSYSICSAPHENEMRVAVKQVENGLFSTYATKELKAGDSLETMAPEGNFKITPVSGEKKNYIFYAAGSGITPVISMIKETLKNNDQSNILLYYGSRTASETIFKFELDDLAANNSNFNLMYLFSREDSGSKSTNGRIDKGKCDHFYESSQKDLSIDGIYTCGPQEMVEIIKDFYSEKGLADKVHFELFTVTAPKKDIKASATVGAIVLSKVTVIIDDEEMEIDLATDGKNILQAAQDAGADVPFSCKGGVCCTCKAKVIEGSAVMDLNYALDDQEVEEGFILTCQAHPTSEKCVVSYDEY